MPEYEIIVPSRGRSGSMSTHLFFPQAIYVVDKKELSQYQLMHPTLQFDCHDGFDSMPKLRNWILSRFGGNKPIVMIDDDLMGIRSYVHNKPKEYRDPDFMNAIVNNMISLLIDLNAGIGCWSRIASPTYFRAFNPFNTVSIMGGAYCINSKRKYIFDEMFKVIDDIDFSMQALQHDRFVICDNRFYWRFNKTQSLRGGGQMIRTSKNDEADIQRLQRKWGKYIKVKSGVKLNSGSCSKIRRSISACVTRSSTLAIL